MIKRLKKLKFKTAPTLNTFIKKVDDLKQIKEYVAFLDNTPERTDFINFDNEGFALNDNVPLFKGWTECLDASNDEIKVATLDGVKIYFDTADGVIIANMTNMCDETTYNDLFAFFEGELELN